MTCTECGSDAEFPGPCPPCGESLARAATHGFVAWGPPSVVDTASLVRCRGSPARTRLANGWEFLAWDEKKT